MTRWRVATLGSSILLLSPGCGGEPQTMRTLRPVAKHSEQSDAELPEVTVEEEEGFVDLVFRIQHYTRLAGGSQVLRVAGRHRGRKVGFEVVLEPGWKQRPTEKDV